MPVEVILPKVDMDMATGRISKWHVAEGQAVRQGDLLFEIETDKAAMEIDAPATGIVRDISGREGVDIPVGQAVAWIYADDEAGAAATVPSPASATAAPLRANEDAAAGAPPATGLAGPAAPPVHADPFPRREGKERASPLARRLARERGIDLSAIAGSGPRGRIVRADVEAVRLQTPVSQGAAGHTVLVTEKDGAIRALFEPGSYEPVPHSALRQTVAHRSAEAKSTIPHFYLTAHCTIDALLRLRQDLNDAAPVRDGEPAWRISVNDLVVKALAIALTEVPEANVTWTGEALLRHSRVDVGVAVAVPGGLLTPIVRDAGRRTLSVLSNEARTLAQQARAGTLRPEDCRGGTTTVSNLGMYGISGFAAVINPPHATIMAVGAGERGAVAGDDDILRAATVMTVTLSADHRAVDGAVAAELLAAFRRAVQHPLSLVT